MSEPSTEAQFTVSSGAPINLNVPPAPTRLRLPADGEICFGERCYDAKAFTEAREAEMQVRDLYFDTASHVACVGIEKPPPPAMPFPLTFGGAFLAFALGIRLLLRAAGLRKLW